MASHPVKRNFLEQSAMRGALWSAVPGLRDRFCSGQGVRRQRRTVRGDRGCEQARTIEAAARRGGPHSTAPAAFTLFSRGGSLIPIAVRQAAGATADFLGTFPYRLRLSRYRANHTIGRPDINKGESQ